MPRFAAGTSKKCMVCRSDGKGKCNASGITYELVCQRCGDKYIGETAGSAFSRGKEHLMAMEKKDETSVMYRHAKQKHQGQVPQFTMNLTGIFRNDALLRQITESVLINKVKISNRINNK